MDPCLIMALRDALRSELQATNEYDDILQKTDNQHVKEVLNEIKKDEINHQGRLTELIMKLAPSDMEPFNEGLEQKG